MANKVHNYSYGASSFLNRFHEKQMQYEKSHQLKEREEQAQKHKERMLEMKLKHQRKMAEYKKYHSK